jgi:2-polyprenyl-6-methoxyphenol hydroxylase-like FAD-dependent oxidoreductase
MERLITIAGGGLAGLSCGVGLRQRGVPVCVHEAGTYPRHRVCGEFISGVSDDVLERLGILSCFDGAARLESMAWFRGGRKILSARLPRAARGISRHTLDLRLRNALINTGGQVYESSRVPNLPRPGFLWCGGRPPAKGGSVGLKAHFQNLALTADLEMHLGRGAYVGLCHVEGDHVNVCGLFPADALKSGIKPEQFQDVLAAFGLEVLASRLKSADLVGGSLRAVAAFRPGWQPGPAAIGDSCAVIPPFTGNGMSMAFEGADIAASALEAYGRGCGSWEDGLQVMHHRLKRAFRTRMGFARFLHPFLTRRPGQFLLAACVSGRILPLHSTFSLLR